MSVFVSRLAVASLLAWVCAQALPAAEPPKPASVPAKSEPAKAEPAKPEEPKPTSFDRQVVPLLGTYCYGCHNDQKTKGDVNLKQDENPRLVVQHRKTWLTVVKMLREHEMPPEKAKQQPSDADRKLLADFVDQMVNNLDCAHVDDPGKPSAHRLNRAEYDNSIRALFGIELNPAKDFTPDSVGYGFDNIGEALTMPPVLVEQYYTAAQRILDAVYQQPAAFAQLVPVRPTKIVSERDAARAAITRFATQAYRRPVAAAHVDKLLAIFDKATGKGQPFAEALRPMLTAVLISPRFLVRIEDDRPDANGPYPVGGYDLASRLSYFLWSGPPDEELLELAAANQLGNRQVLEKQARRMLADPRSRALAENFAAQWLKLRDLDAHKPDTKQFPMYTESLRQAMADEAESFISEIVQQDRPITDLLDADYTYLNEELAKHYGIDGVAGPAMRRVTLSDHRRGGVITMGAVLTITSDPQRTNIPRRGNYLLGAILGTPPPPPPPMVPALEESSKAGGAQKTLRELLEIHRRKPECAACHAKMDPLGFGLENFDAIGRWQSEQAGKPIDSSGLLPGGETFAGPQALKQILLARKPAFTKALAEKLLIYALGRGLQYQDDCVVNDTVAAAERGGYRFSAMVVTIVTSFPFTNRRNPD